jgi:hypothetical protein
LDITPVGVVELVPLERFVAFDDKPMDRKFITRDRAEQVVASATQFNIIPTPATSDIIQRFHKRT